MLQITPQTTILVASKPIDFRKGIDGLAAFCRNHLNTEPMSGTFFLFYNRKANTIKILTYDGQGFWLSIKRLSKGTFKTKPKCSTESAAQQICHRTLFILINNGDPKTVQIPKNWRALRGN
jgi:transposase